MTDAIEFRAPWSAALRNSSIVTCLVLGAILVSGLVTLRHHGWLPGSILVVLPLIIAGAALPFMIRGYVLTEKEIIVRRLGWNTHLPVTGLVSVTGNNEAMLRSLRVFGNGGLFSYSGEFWNRSQGRYRALATDASRAVVLRYPKRRIVITPDDPQRFIVRARTLLKNQR